jgi:hypothetical protein
MATVRGAAAGIYSMYSTGMPEPTAPTGLEVRLHAPVCLEHGLTVDLWLDTAADTLSA